MMKKMLGVGLAALAVAGCLTGKSLKTVGRAEALDKSTWNAASEWISVKDAKVLTDEEKKVQRAADGTSWFVGKVVNAADIVSAKWMTTGLGVYEIYVNGKRVGDDALKPGFTHVKKTRAAFTYDVTEFMNLKEGAENAFAAEVSAGWWRDKIVNFAGAKSAFRGVLEVTYKDGTKRLYGTNTSDWKCGVTGPVTHAAIFDGEEYDARVAAPYFGEGLEAAPEKNNEFAGEIVPTMGAEIVRRCDRKLDFVAAYRWKAVEGANELKGKDQVFGHVVKTLKYAPGAPLSVVPGETLVVDFGQNAAAVPCFRFKAAKGTVLTALPGEMLNDANGERSRGNDGPAGSLYRENLRCPAIGMRLVYTFAGDEVETYMPRHTFFGYRYVSITATGNVQIECLRSVPVTSIKKCMELGSVETGVKDVNKLISNVYWGQLSNYLSVPTDCPQRNERLGWSADTQVFCEAGSYNANTSRFFDKYSRDLRDSRCVDGGYPSVAPWAQYGNETFNLGWADVGVVVPYRVWQMFGYRKIIEDNFDAMSKFVRKLDETKYNFEGKVGYIYADWLSYEKFETCGNTFGDWGKWKNHPDAKNYRLFLAACYWLYDAQMMVEISDALGRKADADWFRGSVARARAHIRATFVEKDGLLLKPMRDIQTACIFALHFNIVEGAARTATADLLKKSIKDHGDCLQTGFLGTSFLMDTLTEIGAVDVAYTLLLQHKNPSWLYSVDQGATTIWERWNSYRKDTGFGPVGMNSFNHYAYGAVLAWIYKTAAGIAVDPKDPGFRTIVMAPKPDKRLGSIKAEYKTPQGVVKSAWRYEGEKWIWEFTVPADSIARVTLPGDSFSTVYNAGTYTVSR